MFLVAACSSQPVPVDISPPSPRATIEARVKPRSPLSHRACAREAHGWGYQIDAARGQCARGDRAPWFHATITNAAAKPTYVKCDVTAWNRGSQRLFDATLPTVVVAPPAGVFLARHRTRSLDWFFDTDAFPEAVGHLHDVDSYTAECKPWINPPI
jgi:hypothetical protein